MKLEHVLNVQYIQSPTPLTFCSRLNQKYITVLSLSLSTSLISFWLENIDLSKIVRGWWPRFGMAIFDIHILLKLSKQFHLYMKPFIYLLKNLYWKTKFCRAGAFRLAFFYSELELEPQSSGGQIGASSKLEPIVHLCPPSWTYFWLFPR